MRIKIINPNTTWAMTEKIGSCARAVAGAGVLVDAVSPSMGPASIESHYDEALAAPGVLAEILAGEESGIDAYVIACFGDPALSAARELTRKPVLGIAEAAMHAATMLGRTFSVVTTLARTVEQCRDLTVRYGFERSCRAIHSTGLAVLDLDKPESDARTIVTEACRRALHEDGTDVIVLGCAGMADLCADISAEIGAPVIDGVAAATVLAQALVTLGMGTSDHGEFAPPPAKPYAGLMSRFSLNSIPITAA